MLGAMESTDQDAALKQPVKAAMTAKVKTLQANEPMDSLLPIFDRDEVALVMDGDEFVGLITRVDLINWLRQHPRAA